MARRTKQELEYDIRARRIDRTASVVEQFFKYGAIALLGYFAMSAVQTLAGRTTFADIGLRFIGDVRVSEATAWFFGVGGVGYGLRQRKLRRDTIEALAPRVRERESELDPKRSSSSLPPRGTTRPDDLRR